jgi:hypothetical protein
MMNTVTFCNYIWRDPRIGVERYVGWGSSIDRPHEHRKRSHNNKLHNTLQKCIREGYDPQPQVKICFHQSEEYAKVVECFLIDFYGREDLGLGTLFNLTDGGEGASGRIATEQTRQKMSVSKTGQKYDGENYRKAALVRTYTPERNANVSAGLMGHVTTDETRHKISTKVEERGGHVGENNPMFGKTQTAETKRIIGDKAIARAIVKRERKFLWFLFMLIDRGWTTLQIQCLFGVKEVENVRV